MGSILNHTSEQAELIGLYHGLRAAELDPDNVEIMEYLLYFNHIPEKILSDSMAIEFAEKIILKKPESGVALLTLSKLKVRVPGCYGNKRNSGRHSREAYYRYFLFRLL